VADVRFNRRVSGSYGPVEEGQTVVVVGGGPAGVSCALTVVRLSREAGRSVRVVLFEGKRFGGRLPHYNQCVGVLSPPIRDILERQLGVPFPWQLVCRPITSYVLHSDNRQLSLGDEDEVCYAVRRVEFDDYLLEEARSAGVEVVPSRVHDLEFHADHVVVYSESLSREAAVVVGAFGLDDGAARMFERTTGYRPPRALTSVVTNIHPEPRFMAEFGNVIHAFLPSIPEIEFGAVTPKSNHLTINVAGRDVDSPSMERFLRLPSVRAVLPGAETWQRPGDGSGREDLRLFRGRFPVSVAAGLCGHRYMVIGDAAGLIRPFKGKGINAGLRGGIVAGEAIVRHGVSQSALSSYLLGHDYAREVLEDRPYAAGLRLLANVGANCHVLDPVLELAERDERLRRALFYCVSAHQPYRQVVLETVSPGLLLRLAAAVAGEVLRAKGLGLGGTRLRAGRRSAASQSGALQPPPAHDA